MSCGGDTLKGDLQSSQLSVLLRILSLGSWTPCWHLERFCEHLCLEGLSKLRRVEMRRQWCMQPQRVPHRTAETHMYRGEERTALVMYMLIVGSGGRHLRKRPPRTHVVSFLSSDNTPYSREMAFPEKWCLQKGSTDASKHPIVYLSSRWSWLDTHPMGEQLSLQREALPMMDSEIQDLSLVDSATGTVGPFGCFHACSSFRKQNYNNSRKTDAVQGWRRSWRDAIIFTTWCRSLWSLYRQGLAVWARESVPSSRQTPLGFCGFCPSLDLGWRLIWNLFLVLSLSCQWLTGSSGPHTDPVYIMLML